MTPFYDLEQTDMNKSNELNQRFGIKDTVEFREGPGGLTMIDVSTPEADATITPQGAQVLNWVPKNEHPVIWLSPAAKYVPNKSVRGGIPICWPWFGPHESHADFPAHGIARTSQWQVNSVVRSDDGHVRVVFTLPQTVDTGAYWPYVSPLQYTVTIGDSLELELFTRNESETDITLGEALHTYFAVSDVRRAKIGGLHGHWYLDKVDAGQRKEQNGDVSINSEVDRIYLDTGSQCVIEDSGWNRRIRIETQGSRSTVVWNPWIDKSGILGDLGDEGYLHMLCVESANAADNVVIVPAGGEHRLWVKYQIEN